MEGIQQALNYSMQYLTIRRLVAKRAVGDYEVDGVVMGDHTDRDLPNLLEKRDKGVHSGVGSPIDCGVTDTASCDGLPNQGHTGVLQGKYACSVPENGQPAPPYIPDAV